MTVSAAESPTSPEIPPLVGGSAGDGLRASDAERDETAGELGEHFAAGRLSHDTFVRRMNAVMRARRRSELPPLLSDLPPKDPSPGASPGERVRGWLEGGWSAIRDGASSALDGLRLTSGFPADPGPVSRHPAPVSIPAPGPVPAVLARVLQSLPFPRGAATSFLIGRDRECDLVIEDLTVSRVHAVLERADGGWVLTDRGSTNGTRVNGWRVRDTVPVRAGDVVRFGDSLYTLAGSGEE